MENLVFVLVFVLVVVRVNDYETNADIGRYSRRLAAMLSNVCR